MCAVASVSWGGRRPSLAGYVMVTGGRAGATAAGGCECWRSSGREESRQCLLRCGLVVHDAFSHLRNSNTRRQNDGQGQRDVPQYPRGSIRPRVLPGQAYAARKEEDGRQLQVLHGGQRKGLAGGAPGAPATYVGMCHIFCESVEALQAGFGPHAQEIMADIPNYTDLSPVIQISEVVVG